MANQPAQHDESSGSQGASPRRGLWFVGSAALTMAGLVTFISGWVWGVGDESLWLAAAGVAGIGWGMFGVWSLWRRVGTAYRTGAILIAAVTVVSGGTGAVTQTVLDGKPVWRWSGAAAAAHDVERLLDGLDGLVHADELLVVPDDQVRHRRTDFDAAIVALEELVREWGARDAASFANPELADAARSLTVAADAGSAALELRLANAEFPEPSRTDAIVASREVLVREALQAGVLLRSGAEHAGVESVLAGQVLE